MKSLMLIGGMCGFLMGMLSALSQSCSGAAVLWRASVAAYLTGFLVRWLGKVWLVNFSEVQQRRLAEAAAAKQQPNPSKN